MKSSPPVNTSVRNSDVKQLLLKIGNFTHSYESSKGTSSKALCFAKTIIAGGIQNAVAGHFRSESNRTLVRYDEDGGKLDVNLNSAYARGMSNTNASFMLCPKP